MDKQTSLLVITYLHGLTLGVIGALLATALSASGAFAAICPQMNCTPFALNPEIPSFFIISGGLMAFATVMLSRGLYRLFFVET